MGSMEGGISIGNDDGDDNDDDNDEKKTRCGGVLSE